MPDISSKTVIGALYDLKHRWPVTATEIASYLKCSDEVVLTHLRGLKSQRLVRERRRHGNRCWQPWEAP